MQSPVLPQGQQDADLDFSEFECAHLQNLTQSEDLSPLVSSIYGRRHKSHQPLWYDFQQCMVPGADNPDRGVRVLSASAEGESAMTKPCACEKESGRKQNASGLWAVVLAASMLTSLSVAMYCWRLQGQLWAHENAMERVLETLSRRQESGLSSVPAEVTSFILPDDENAGYTDTPRKREKRNDMIAFVNSLIRDYLTNYPKVHLRGQTRETTDWIHDNYVLWKLEGSFQKVGVGLETISHAPNRIVGVTIHQRGIYVVYSQIVVHGKHENRSAIRTDCAHQTVVLDPFTSPTAATGNTKVLMESFLTQNKLGDEIVTQVHPPPHYPRDTALQMGVFFLERQNQVRVQLSSHDPDCRNTKFSISETATYFGLYRIA